MSKPDLALLQRTIDNPMSPEPAKQAARELLAESQQQPIAFHPPDSSRAADKKALITFGVIVRGTSQFQEMAEKIPFTLSRETAELILNLAECGYLNRHAVKK
jgi:hypothetical protein